MGAELLIILFIIPWLVLIAFVIGSATWWWAGLMARTAAKLCQDEKFRLWALKGGRWTGFFGGFAGLQTEAGRILMLTLTPIAGPLYAQFIAFAVLTAGAAALPGLVLHQIEKDLALQNG
jgi:hypothetical protein